MRIAFLGSGNMAGAIVRGVVADGTVSPEDVIVTSLHGQSAQRLARETGVDVVPTNEEAVEQAGPGGIVVLAVKPHVLSEVLPPLRDVLAEQGSVVVSIAAGTSIAWLEEQLAPGQPVVRVMPNVPAQIGQGLSAVCGNDHADDATVDDVVAVLEAVGLVVRLPEHQFSVFTALAGSSPAFTFAYIDALARGGVQGGLHKTQAVRLAAQAVAGAAQLVLARLAEGTTPKDLEDTVSSPSGTTIAGTIALDQAGFTAAVLQGVRAVIDRDIALGTEK